ALYATDDRYTDDVHYMGGTLRMLDLIDYPLYMVAMNALPPTPSVWDGKGDDSWVDEWRRRIETNEPWLLEWMRHPLPDPMWRRGSVRTGPDGAGYERFTCPVFLIAGWADGYRNNTFRTMQHVPGTRLLAGPWVHKAPANAVPGPNVDDDLELMRFFDEHLRGGEPMHEHLAHVFVRKPSPPEPDLVQMDGTWVQTDQWPPEWMDETWFVGTGDGVDTLAARGDVGVAAWNSCAGGLPWGQPLDQRHDNAMSIVHDFPITDPRLVLGNGDVRLRARSSAPVGHVSVKLCDVAPDGTSVLITRGFMDLTHRGVWPSDPWGHVGAAPQPLEPGTWMDVRIELEATTWALVPGHTLRLAIAGTDWPNCWPPTQPFTLGVQRDSVRLTLPTHAGLPELTDPLVSLPGHDSLSHEGVEWRIEHDVLGRETSVHTLYGERYEGKHGTVVTDHYEGHVGISTTDLSRGWVRGDSNYTMEFPEGTCFVQATLDMHSDADAFHVTVELTATLNGDHFGHRTWTEVLPR
ncbi:MAG: CocE/NonD family hydrolase C-terminal non-catalytic domain-containing protein, partial [Ilumatobacteraceae bacterium]